jgi:hypothetical protein
MLIPLYLQFGKYKPDWGDVPTWAAAALALIAGLVAYRAYVVSSRALAVSSEAHETTRKLLGVELERDEEARQDRRDRDEAERRAQADRFAAWATASAVYVKNANDLPIYDVHCVPYFHHRDTEPEMAFFLGLSDGQVRWGVMPPGAQEEGWFDLHPDVFARIGDDEGDFLISMTFRDAAGIRWKRDHFGKLTELPSS